MFGNYFNFLNKSRGSTATVINVDPDTYSVETVDPTSAACKMSFNSNGTITLYSDIGTSYSWSVPGGTGSLYSVRVTNISGTINVGTAGTWQNLASSRTFGVSQAAVGSKAATVTIEIRRDSDSVVLDSASVSFTATVTL